MDCRVDDLQGSDTAALLRAHLQHCRRYSPPQSCHALDLQASRAPEVTFWTAWESGTLLGCGALKELDAAHGEIKSMHTVAEYRGRGVASALLTHMIEVAESRGYQRLSLETGSMAAFAGSRALYERFGFGYTKPFGDYVADPNSVHMTLDLRSRPAAHS